MRPPSPRRVWFFDLDNTLHNASAHVFGALHRSMGDYIEVHLGVPQAEASRLRALYWQRYGATLLGLVRHHGVRADHFLHQTHKLDGIESLLHTHAHDLAALKRLRGRKFLLTNAPQAYAQRVLETLGMQHCFEAIIPCEQMRMFGHWRLKPDARMFRAMLARLKLQARDCVLVEDTLVHQKSARRVGMRTVWMQRWVHKAAAKHGPEAGIGLRRRPVYVDQRIRALSQLRF